MSTKLYREKNNRRAGYENKQRCVFKSKKEVPVVWGTIFTEKDVSQRRQVQRANGRAHNGAWDI